MLLACCFSLAATAQIDSLQQQLRIHRQHGDQRKTAGALLELGFQYGSDYQSDTAFACFEEALQLYRQLNDSSMMAQCFNNFGVLYYRLGDFTNSIYNYQQCLAIERKLKNDTATGQCLTNIGMCYRSKGESDSALSNLLNGLRYLEIVRDSDNIATAYNSIGNVFLGQKEYDKAIDYFSSALSMRMRLGNKRGVAKALNNLGEAYMRKGDYPRALDYLNNALRLKRELNDKGSIATSLDMLAELYFLQQDFEKSEENYRQSLQIKQEVGDLQGQAISLNKLGDLYTSWKKFDLADSSLHQARTIASGIGAKTELLQNYKLSIQLYRVTGNQPEMIRFYDQYTALKDSVINEQKNKALAEMETRYGAQKKEQELKTSAAVVARQHTVIWSLAVGTVLLVLLIVLALAVIRSGRKTNAQKQLIIQQKQALLDQKQAMMRELHHRIKNNLQVLASLLELQQGRTGDAAAKEALKAVEHRLSAMLLIHQDLYSEQAGSQVSIDEYIRRITDNLLFAYGYSKQTVDVQIDVDAVALDADKALNAGFICNEIISNAFKHGLKNVAQPVLRISLKKVQEELQLIISDNGKGMPQDVTAENSSSFGLRLIRLFVDDLRGTLQWRSDAQGTTFEIHIPQTPTA